MTFIDSDDLLMSETVERMMSSAVVQNILADNSLVSMTIKG